MTEKSIKIVLPGGAGLVGQNLIVRLREKATQTSLSWINLATISVLSEQGLWVTDTSCYYPEDRGSSESIGFLVGKWREWL